MHKKKKKLNSRTKQTERKPLKKNAGLIYTRQPGNNFKYIILFPILLVVVAGIYFIYSSYKTNGYFGFPLDDPWIHLTFAKNLIEYGSFSYYKNEIVTSGSTSPVYTLLLSLLYIIIKNEFIISYLPGIIFGVLLVYIMTKLTFIEFNNAALLALFTAMLVALQPKLNLINVSGMETSMFIFFIAASLYAYQSKRMVLLGFFLGLTIWCRPDGFILWIAIAFDYFLQRYYLGIFVKPSSEKRIAQQEIKTAFFIAFLFVALYFVFNYLLSGSILPNTYQAKLEYYQNKDRTYFLENDVLKYFTQSEFIIIWLPFLFGVLGIIKSFFKKEHNNFLVYLLFIVGLIAAYYIKLPFAHRFGRYLMPVIPFYILIAVAGVKIIIDFIAKNISNKNSVLPNLVFVLYVISAFAVFINQSTKSLEEYTFHNKYHNDRHVTAGKWLNANTDESVIVATHDVGAIAFYGERKIIDMAGVVTPELIDHIKDKLYSEYMNNFLAKSKVDYVVTLRNWFEVVNDKPVFIPVDKFEFMEIFKYNPSQTHIQPKVVSQINQAALQMLQNGAPSNAIAYLNQSISIDSRSSRTYLLLGIAYQSLKDFLMAERNLNKALELYPAFTEALYQIAIINFERGKIEDSQSYVSRCLSVSPDFVPAIQLQNRLAALTNK